MYDPRVKEHLIRNTARLDSWIKARNKNPGDRTHQTVHQLTAITDATGSHRDNFPKLKQRPRVLLHCNGEGHVRADCRKRQKDLATAEGRPVAATTAAGAGQSASNMITPQIGALPRHEQYTSKSFFFATPLNDDAWARTHRKNTSNNRTWVAPP